MSVSLYFHIPFCSKKCPYCHFYVIPNQQRFHALLEEGLEREWAVQRPLLEGKKIVSIYFGGGTPTLFGASAIARVLARCRTLTLAPDCEITIEANPEESSKALFTDLREVGINRVSLGVQSLDDRSLFTLERQHSAARAKEAIFNAHAAGIQNISIDLMYDLPDQTESSWRTTLSALEELPFTHLSLYNLTIEPHTPFAKRPLNRPTAEQSLRFLELALERLAKLGLERYEISAFAKPDCRSRHNVGYWTFRPFLGFGPSAFSFWNGERFRNVANIQRYARALREGVSPVDFREKLEYPANVKEQLAVQLRLCDGVELAALKIPEETRGALRKLEELGLVSQVGGRVKLTERGMLMYDSVAEELV